MSSSVASLGPVLWLLLGAVGCAASGGRDPDGDAGTISGGGGGTQTVVTTPATGSGSGGGTTSGSGASDGAFLGSCDTRSSTGSLKSECRDWVGNSGPDLKYSCDGMNGTYSSTDHCPGGRVAHCTTDASLGFSAVYNYYSPDWTVDSARTACKDVGTFAEN